VARVDADVNERDAHSPRLLPVGAVAYLRYSLRCSGSRVIPQRGRRGWGKSRRSTLPANFATDLMATVAHNGPHLPLFQAEIEKDNGRWIEKVKE
jgi:hypothetical protein